MKINDLFESQEQLDELSLGGVGRGLAKGVGAVAKGASALAGGVSGAWDQAKQGYQIGKAAVNGQPIPQAPGAVPAAAPGAEVAAAPAANAAAPAANAAAPAAPDPKAVAQTKMNTKQVMALWATLPAPTKKAVLTRLTADTAKSAQAKPVANAAAPGAEVAANPAATTPPPVAPAPDAEVATAVPGKKVRVRTGGKKAAAAPVAPEGDPMIAALNARKAAGIGENYKFESKFLGMKI